MNTSKYAEKFKDPRWQKLRLQILERDEWSCQLCGDEKSPLNVHHRYYIAGKELWEYEPDLLVTLCENCHKDETEIIKDAIETLECAFRSQFFASDIHNIACSVGTMKLLHTSEVVASVFSWVFRMPDIQKELIDRYFAYLKEKKSNVGGNSKKA